MVNLLGRINLPFNFANKLGIQSVKKKGWQINMEELFTVKISDERFPALSECTKETNISLVIVQCGSDSVELTIESQEPDNNIESEYQEPTYIVWITDQGETIDKLVHPFDFENMEVREIIHTMIDIYMDECRNR